MGMVVWSDWSLNKSGRMGKFDCMLHLVGRSLAEGKLLLVLVSASNF